MSKDKKPSFMTNEAFQSNMMLMMNSYLQNTESLRQALINRSLTGTKNINQECDYPTNITIQDYYEMFAREGAGHRVVDLFPSESWAKFPKIFETEDQKETEFEKTLEDLQRRFNIYSYMQRIDVASGIGRYGILLLGIDDKLEYNEPVEGIDLETIMNPYSTQNRTERKLLFLKPFDESLITIAATETDTSNPRYGMPTIYSVKIGTNTETLTGDVTDTTTQKAISVHWTRVIHVADNRLNSDIFGMPRQMPVWNRLVDLRKTYGAAGEGYWKGAFPGYAFTTQPDVDGAQLDTDSLKEEMTAYMNNFQRFMALSGLNVEPLAVQATDPEPFWMSCIKNICFTLGIPVRKFIGTESSHLSSTQDEDTWNNRIMSRNEKYVSPFIIRPVIDRLIAYGVLPTPSEEYGYTIKWPDLNALSGKEKAEVAKTKTEALGAYVQKGVEEIMPPEIYLKNVMDMTQDEIDETMSQLKEMEDELSEEENEIEQESSNESEGE